jgi:hypothetical protein
MHHIAPGRAAIIVAGMATTAMGAFHFVLPPLFGWARFATALPAEIQWALFAMNAFLSLLLLSGGLASLMAIRRPNAGARPVIWMMTGFWLFNACYQLAQPFPTTGVRWILLGFAAVVALLYGAGLFLDGVRTCGSMQPSDEATV